MVEIRRRGFILVLSSPSGAGKTTLTRRLLAADAGLSLSVSVTTRPRRPNEADGVDYHFIGRAEFDRMLAADELLEHATVFGNSYGTPRQPVEAVFAAGREIVGDLDWQGTQQLKEKIERDVVSVFILPPAVDELERRLRARNQDSEEVVRYRMARALEEMSHWSEYDYVLVNRDLDDSLAVLQSIIRAERGEARAPGRARRFRAGNQRPVISRQFRASAQNSGTVSSSARAVGSTPAAAHSAAGSTSPSVFRLARSILRRWPKAAAVMRSRSSKRQGASFSGRGTRLTTVEVTLGAGRKAPGGTSKTRVGTVSHCTRIDSRP